MRKFPKTCQSKRREEMLKEAPVEAVSSGKTHARVCGRRQMLKKINMGKKLVRRDSN